MHKLLHTKLNGIDRTYTELSQIGHSMRLNLVEVIITQFPSEVLYSISRDTHI